MNTLVYRILHWIDAKTVDQAYWVFRKIILLKNVLAYPGARAALKHKDFMELTPRQRIALTRVHPEMAKFYLRRDGY